MNTKPVIFPTPNLNGTSARTLIEDYYAAMKAVENAYEAVQKIEFHPRDYPGEGEWNTASNERQEILTTLKTIESHFEAIALHVLENQR